MKSKRQIVVWMRLLAPLVILGVAQAGCGGDPEPTENAEPVYLNWAPEAKYVGRDACKSCHLENYESFVKSQMGRSWKPARRSLSNADFDNPDPVYAPVQDLYYQPFARGEDLYVREYRIAFGDTVHNRVEKIDYIVGSGQHTNSHIRSTNGYLFQIPVTYYVQDGMWDLAPGFASRNSRFDRPIPAECMTCHNGISPHVVGSENRFESVAEGIGCEKCHGPGSVHVDAINAGIVVDINTAIDYTIVHPGKLSPEREWDLCSRCHMQGVDVFRPGVHPDDFRPGKALADYQNVLWPRQADSVAVFNMASHPDRLAMSKCFEPSWSSDGRFTPMTCKTCHNPHLAVELTSDTEYSAICQSCHALPDAVTCTEPTVVAGTTDLGCATCHMPMSGTDDIPHVRITDHYIRVPEVAPVLTEEEAEEQRRIIRMASIIDRNPGVIDMAKGFLSYYEKISGRPDMLELAAESLARTTRADDRDAVAAAQIWLWYLQTDYAAIRVFVEQRPNLLEDDAWTQLRIGEAYRDSGDWGRALGFLKRAVELQPLHLRFLDRLASTYSNLGEFGTAIGLFDRLLEANPTSATALNNRGYAYLLQGLFGEAERDFVAAIRLDPDTEVTLANLASIYVNTDREAEARPLVRRLLALDPNNPDYGMLWQAAAR